MRRIIIVFILPSFFILRSSFADAQVVSEITALAGEKWWGMFAGNSPEQPFAQPFEVNTTAVNGEGFYAPFMVSSAGRYVSSEYPFGVVFDGVKFRITSETDRVTARKGGRTLRQAYLSMHHRNFSESAKVPPKDFFTNLIYETQSELGFLNTADDVAAYARRLLDEGFPAGIIVVPDGWHLPETYDFDRRYYPMPASFVSEMHLMGFKVMLTVSPYVPAWGRDFAALDKAGLLVCGDDGKPLIMSDGQGSFAAVTIWHPDYNGKIKEDLKAFAQRNGVDGFRFDFSALYDAMAVHSPGNLMQMMRAVREIGAEFALAEFMPGVPGFQSDYVAAIRTSKTGEAEYLSDAATAGIAAGPFTQVLPGAMGGRSDRAVVRYALIQAMMPVARVPFAPWKYNFAADEIQKTLTFRASLAQYMERMFDEASKTVEPVVRPMEYQFANCGFADCADQYMLGDKYLVAPALDDNLKRLVRLPRGTWRDMNGQKHKGPLVIEIENAGYKMTVFELQ